MAVMGVPGKAPALRSVSPQACACVQSWSVAGGAPLSFVLPTILCLPGRLDLPTQSLESLA